MLFFCCHEYTNLHEYLNNMDDNVVEKDSVPVVAPEAAADGIADVSTSSESSVAASPLRGRAAYKARLKERKPDVPDDIGDDDLFDDALSSLSDTQSKYDELVGSNKRLAELVSKDPKLAALLTMIAGDNPKSIQYAVGKLFGRDLLEADDEGLDEFEKGYQEHLQGLSRDREALEEASKNIETYQRTLDKFGKSNGLKEDALDLLGDAVEKLAVDVLKGNISESFIDFVWKGMNYEKDVEDAAAAGEAEGKNKVVAPQLRKMADVAPTGGTPSTSRGTDRPSSARKRSFYDDVKDV